MAGVTSSLCAIGQKAFTDSLSIYGVIFACDVQKGILLARLQHSSTEQQWQLKRSLRRASKRTTSLGGLVLVAASGKRSFLPGPLLTKKSSRSKRLDSRVQRFVAKPLSSQISRSNVDIRLIKATQCPTCSSHTVAESCRSIHCCGEGFEKREFACGCTLRWSPNFSRLEVDVECPVAVKKRREEEAKKPLPCPFCGSPAELYKTQKGDMIGIQCSTHKCGVNTLGPHRKTEEEVVQVWNKRWKNESAS